MSRFWSPFVKDLVPYVPGEQPKLANLVKLNTNENPYGPSPAALAAIKVELNDSLRLYPDPNGDLLKRAVADFYGLDTAQIFVGNGSDEVLAHVFHGLLQHDAPILFPDITYSFYPVYAGLYGISYDAVPLDSTFQIRLEDYERKNGGIVFPNPNAPTGRVLTLPAIEKLLQANADSVVVVDEAYIDFGGESAVALIPRYPNLLVTQTVSKGRSLAGLRVGLAMGNPALIEALERIKDSFNSYPLDRLAIAGAAAAFADKEWFEHCRLGVIAERDRLNQALEGLGFEVLPSAANFLFARHPEHEGKNIATALRERGVVVRHFNKPRIDQFLRITIGTPEQHQSLLAALTEILGAKEHS